MPSQISHPLICEYFPQFKTKHAAAVFIEFYKAKGHMKRCGHLSIRKYGDDWSASTFGPDCEENSFDTRDAEYRKRAFYGCPKDCRLYEAAWRGKTKRWFKDKYWPFRRFVVGTAQLYVSLAPIAQVIIAIAFLALIGAPWRGTIVEILRIVYPSK